MAKKVEKTICSYCTHEFHNKDLNWGEKEMFEGKPKCGRYQFPICTKCSAKHPEVEIASSFIKVYTQNKADKAVDISNIDFSKCVKGTPSKNNKERFMFINSNGKEVLLVLENGLKRGYELVTKK